MWWGEGAGLGNHDASSPNPTQHSVHLVCRSQPLGSMSIRSLVCPPQMAPVRKHELLPYIQHSYSLLSNTFLIQILFVSLLSDWIGLYCKGTEQLHYQSCVERGNGSVGDARSSCYVILGGDKSVLLQWDQKIRVTRNQVCILSPTLISCSSPWWVFWFRWRRKSIWQAETQGNQT